MDGNKLLENFESKPAKFLVILALVGIAIALKPIYETLDYNPGKKLDLYEKWIKVSGNQADTVLLDAIRTQVEIELAKPGYKLESGLSALGRNASYLPWYTFIYKFLSGGLLFLIIYGLQVVFKTKVYIGQIKSGKNRTKTLRRAIREVVGRNIRIVWIWLWLSLVNTAFPMLSLTVNYVFIPSVLTLFCAIGLVLWQEADKRVPVG